MSLKIPIQAILAILAILTINTATQTIHHKETCQGCKKIRSFLPHSAHTDFTIHNIPFGVFKLKDHPDEPARCGTRIGHYVIDLAFMEKHHLILIQGTESEVFNQPDLNAFMALGKANWSDVRLQI
jgi:fumarylacetoacetase